MGTPCSFFTGTCQIHHLVHQDFTNTNFGTFIEQSFDNIKLPFCERSIIRFIWNWFFERFLYKLFCPIFLSNTFIGDLKGSFGNFNALWNSFMKNNTPHQDLVVSENDPNLVSFQCFLAMANQSKGNQIII